MKPSVIYDLLRRGHRLSDVLPNAANSNIYGIKDKARLIEKIDEKNKQIKGGLVGGGNH